MTGTAKPRLLLAATHSGAGKTTLAAGLAAAWRRAGRRVAAFKAGPDYIDPSYLTLASGRPARNLDGWLVPGERLRRYFARASSQADVALVEGVMGLFDGAGYLSEAGSAAELSRLLGLPVVLVLDARAAARSVAATALGFVRFAPELPWAGFVVNRAGGSAHGRGVAEAVEAATGLPVFGWLPRLEGLELPHRHLGLVPATEDGLGEAFVNRAAEAVAAHLDLKRLWQAACRAGPLEGPGGEACADLAEDGRGSPGGSAAAGSVVAVARDRAFSFHYVENLELLERAGARLRFFSPLADEPVPPGACGLLLHGGFPEVHAGRLARARTFLESLRAFCRSGRPVYAECGGLMVLTEAIVRDARRYPMAGVLPGEVVMEGRLKLGYREARAAADSWLLLRGEPVRGHEFHYSTWAGRPAHMPAALEWVEAPGRVQRDGAVVGGLWASYVHLNFLSRPELARRFVEASGGRWKRCSLTAC